MISGFIALWVVNTSYDFSSWEFFEICFIVQHIVSFYKSSTYSLAPESRVLYMLTISSVLILFESSLNCFIFVFVLSAAERCMFKMSKYSYRLTVFPCKVLRFYHTEALLVGACMFRNVISFWFSVTCCYEVFLLVPNYAFGFNIDLSGFCVAQSAFFSIFVLYLPFHFFVLEITVLWIIRKLFLKIQSNNLCYLFETLSSFIVNVIAHISEFKPAII